MKIIIFILFLAGSYSFGQTSRIDTLLISRPESFANAQPGKLKFPVIRTGREAVDIKINTDLRDNFLGENYQHVQSGQTTELVTENLAYLDFEVTFNKNGVLSLNISAEGCGAYCTNWTRYYNYSTVTGEPLSLDDIINRSGRFKKRVIKDKDSQFLKERKDLEKMRTDPNAGLDEENYNWASEYYEACRQSFVMSTFALYDDHLEIICECDLPRMIRNLTPIISLKYKFTEIKKDLKINLK